MMRHSFIASIALFVLLASCSPNRQYQKGNNDQAIRLAVKKLKKKPDKQKYLDVLLLAYQDANRQDNERIRFLKKQGTPEIWDEVFQRLNRMKKRQNMVKSLRFIPPNITFTDYDEEIIHAKQKAAAYYYQHGVKLLSRNNRQDARTAYGDFLKVKSYFRDFKDVDALLNKARQAGTTTVLFRMENQSDVILPAGFESELLKISLSELDEQWIRYYVSRTDNMHYDYQVVMRITGINISPERSEEKSHIEEKEIEDGWQYVLDEKGNVMKDSLGNDIKTPKYKTITCKVIETHQSKAARISGTLDYIDNSNGNLIKTDPVAYETLFDHFSTIALGDKRALSPETRKKLNGGPVPFPTHAELLMQTTGQLKELLKNILCSNSNLLK